MDKRRANLQSQSRGWRQLLVALVVVLVIIRLAPGDGAGLIAALSAMFVAGMLFCRAWVCLSLAADDLQGKQARWDFFHFL